MTWWMWDVAWTDIDYNVEDVISFELQIVVYWWMMMNK